MLYLKFVKQVCLSLLHVYILLIHLSYSNIFSSPLQQMVVRFISTFPQNHSANLWGSRIVWISHVPQRRTC